jgi:hypothetical protein
MDFDAYASDMLKAVRGFVDRALAPVLDRLKMLEARPDPAPVLELVRALVDRPVPAPERGRDALEIQIGDGLDETRSYPAGAFVAAGGGLLRAARPTDPVGIDGDLRAAGWVPIVVGLRSIETALEDGGRVLVTRIRSTIGAEEIRHTTAIPVERGVHRDGKAYAHGDVVEWAGDAWIATKDAPEGKPDVSGDWRRLVRRGREGKSVIAQPAPTVARVG